MSTQVELNSNPYQYILYYCNQNDPTTVFKIDLSDVCSLYYDSNGDIQISSWFISGFVAPTMPSSLLSYTLSNVLSFYDNFYTQPAICAETQFYKISTSNLALMRADASMIGFGIYDTTTKTNKFFNGSSWV